MNLSIDKRIAFGFTVAPAALIALGLASCRNLVELGADSRSAAVMAFADRSERSTG